MKDELFDELINSVREGGRDFPRRTGTISKFRDGAARYQRNSRTIRAFSKSVCSAIGCEYQDFAELGAGKAEACWSSPDLASGGSQAS